MQSPRAVLIALLAGATLWAIPSTTWADSSDQALSKPSDEARADLKSLSLDELFNLEVTSVSARPEQLSETAAAVKVVTSDDIRRTGALSLPEALRYVPGVEVARVDSHQYAITARGFNGTVANKLLVLIDGRSVYTPLFSGVFWDVQDVFLQDVEQIEVVRGPGATIWGANAVNGVINVLSKPAAETQGFLITGGGGDPERGFGGLRYGGSLGEHAYYRVYGKRFDRDASVFPNGEEAEDRFQRDQGGFRFDWAPPGASSATLQGDLYRGRAGQPAGGPTTQSGGNVLGRWARRFSPVSDLQVNAYFDRTRLRLPPTFEELLDTYDVTARQRLSPWKRHDVVFGLGYRQFFDDIRNGTALAFLPPRLLRRVYSGFAQDEVSFAEGRLRWTFGSKAEHNDYTGMEYSPSTRLAWIPRTNETIWAAASRAVRTPSRIDRDFYVPGTPPYLLAGGPGFDSEVEHAYELGYKVQPDGALTTSVATFYNVYDKLRSLETGSGFPIVLANGLKGDSYGAELTAAFQPCRRLRLNGGYTFLRLILETEPTSTDTSQVKQARDSPRHQGFVRASLTLAHDVDVDLGVRAVGKLTNQRVPAYVAWDGRIGWRPVPEIELAIVGRNLFDPRHPEFGTPATRKEVERSLYASATCRF